MQSLSHCMKPNSFGVLELELYTHARVGTKLLIERLVAEVCTSLRWLAAAQCSAAQRQSRADFIRNALASFGTSALVLTGGCTSGIYHYGVVRGLLKLGLLPSTVTGASAGAVVAAVRPPDSHPRTNASTSPPHCSSCQSLPAPICETSRRAR